MKCPNCGKEMKYNFCIFCGYMTNGNFIEKEKKEEKVSDLELALKEEYHKIMRNDTHILTFLLGPLYLCYRNYYFIGLLLEILNLLLFFLFAYLEPIIEVILFPFFRLPWIISFLILILYILIERLLWMNFDNSIYLSLLKKKIKRIEIKKTEKKDISLFEIKTKNIWKVIFSIFNLFLLFLLIIILYRLKNGTL